MSGQTRLLLDKSVASSVCSGQTSRGSVAEMYETALNLIAIRLP